MRDFDWFDELWCVVKDDGSFAGCPCITWCEARELQAQHEGSQIFYMKVTGWVTKKEKEPEDYPDDCDYEVGFDPYCGCFTDDC